jgi:hypothetical protein
MKSVQVAHDLLLAGGRYALSISKGMRNT